MEFIKNLIIFILSLSMLVIIHELGHFVTAKLFGVYCREFSVGMGPLLLKYKKEKGETQFSLRAIPLGGFVSMVGENAGDSELIGGQHDPSENGNEALSAEEEFIMSLPKERRLDGIAKWKRAIIMSAGVFMNLVLAFVLFVVMNCNLSIIDNNKRSFATITENSVVENAGITVQDEFIYGEMTYKITVSKSDNTTEIKQGEIKQNIDDGDDLYDFITFYLNLEQDEELNIAREDVLSYALKTKEKEFKFNIKPVEKKDSKGAYEFEKFGVSFYTRHYNFGEVIGNTFKDMGNSSVAIIKALGTLFTKEGLSQVGGPVAIFQMSAHYTSLGLEYYCMLWGLISVNLAVMNFLPFPGLDGWHFLVLIFEGVTRKEMPSKAKNIISTIGLLLLFGLMIAITFKDVLQLIIIR